MNKIFVGTDLRQPLAFNVLQHSIQMTSKRPVQIIPLLKHQLPITRFGLTDFTFSRYLVPYLCTYNGRALFMDGDMIVLSDINDLFDWHDQFYNGEAPAVSVQIEQPEFEWPSLMMFDNEQCRHLTPEFVNDPSSQPQDLKAWTSEVGVLPPEWNVMVRASEPDIIPLDTAKVLHFTEGLPCFFETQHTPGSAHWRKATKEMNYTVNWRELMGRSIHARPVLQQLIRGYGQ